MPCENNKNGRICTSQFKVEDIIDDEACELVNGVELLIGNGNYEINAYLFKAAMSNNETGILFLSDIFGFEDSATRDFAYCLTCNCYKSSELLRSLSLWVRKIGISLCEFEGLDIRDFACHLACNGYK